MLYDISLRILYAYQAPSDPGIQHLRLLPIDEPGVQRLIAGRIDATPAAEERRDRSDYFGNPVTELRFPPMQSAVDYRMAARVERLARVQELDLSPLLPRLGEEIAALRSLAPSAPQHCLAASPRIRLRAGFTSYAEAVVNPAMTTRQIVIALGEALHGDMRFEPGATEVDTAPEEAFRRRAGVCQDFAQVMIGCLRGLGIPAGYVSGYLRTEPPKGQPRLEGADAMHAWVRAWCGMESGWVEYDPTNATLVGGDHIAVAYGRDYGDVPPVHAHLRTAGQQTSRQEVTVRPLGAASEPR